MKKRGRSSRRWWRRESRERSRISAGTISLRSLDDTSYETLKIQMSPLPEDSPSHWRAACLLGLVILLSFLYFYEGGGWNQNSRFDLLRAIVEQRTLRIDAYHENTQDKAHFQGHYYSDKAPGLVFLACLLYTSPSPRDRTRSRMPSSA